MNIGTSQGFTVEGWIQPLDNNGRPIVEWDSASAYGVHMWANWPSTGNLFANIVDTSGVNHTLWGGPSYIIYGLWHHVALTYDKTSGNAFLYLDGSQVAVANFGNITPQTGFDLYLGKRILNGTTPWFGCLDEVSIYTRPLNPIEVSNIYYSFGNGKCH